MRHRLATMLLIFTTASAAFAHGGGQHVKGTVTSVAGDAIVVDDEHGQPHRVQLDAQTRFRDVSGAAAKASDLRAGDRVVVHLGVETKRSTAVEVRFGHPQGKTEGH